MNELEKLEKQKINGNWFAELIQNEDTRRIESLTLDYIDMANLSPELEVLRVQRSINEGTKIHNNNQTNLKFFPEKYIDKVKNRFIHRTLEQTIADCYKVQPSEVCNMVLPLCEDDTREFFDIKVDNFAVDCFVTNDSVQWKANKMLSEYMDSKNADKAEYILGYELKGDKLIRIGCYLWLTDDIKKAKNIKHKKPDLEYMKTDAYKNAMAELDAA